MELLKQEKQHLNLLEEKLASLHKINTYINEGSNGTLLNSLKTLKALLLKDIKELVLKE